jgi:hypothetical protein
MGAIDFRAKAQALGASFIYAPVDGETALTNYGSLAALPAGALVNGAFMNTPGIVYDGASLGLDGVNDYADTHYLTRTNLAQTPYFTGGNKGCVTNDARVTSATSKAMAIIADESLALTTTEVAAGNTFSCRARINKANKFGAPVGAGVKVTVRAAVQPPTKRKVGFFLRAYNAEGIEIATTNNSAETEVPAAVPTVVWGEWTTPAETAFISVSLCYQGVTIGEEVFWDAICMEQGTKAEVEARGYFPLPAQITAGESAWSGTARESISDTGAFARLSIRTFVSTFSTPSVARNNGLFGGSTSGFSGAFVSATGKLTFRLGDGTTTNDKASASVPAGQTNVAAIVWNGIANTYSSYLNGVISANAVATGTTHNDANQSLRVGSLGLTAFEGQNLPFAVFPTALTEAQVQELTAAATSEPVATFSSSARVKVIYEPQSGRLSFYLRRPDGSMKRVAGDEVAAENVLQNFTFGTAIPGGYTTASGNFTRDPRTDYGDFGVYDEFLARGPGNESAYEGYDIEIPKSSGQQTGVVATGWSSYMKDNATLQEIYVDRDMTRFTPSSATRKIGEYAGNMTPVDGTLTVDPTSGLPALELAVSDTWVSPFIPVCEAWYDAGPSAKVSSVFASVKAVGSIATGVTPWTFWYYMSDDMNAGANPIQGRVPLTGLEANDEPNWPALGFAPRRYLGIQWLYNSTPAGAQGAKFAVLLRNIVVVGQHSVTVQAGYLVLASDVIANILSRAAPLLNFTTGPEGSIVPSTFGIPHLIFPQAVNAEEAVLQTSKYDVPDWGVYDNRQFFWRPPSAGRLWEARESDAGTELVDAGEQAEDVYNGVVVEFTDPSGRTLLVGPPSALGTPIAGCDYASGLLIDESPANPLNEHGRTRYAKLTVGPTTTLSGAEQLGMRWLQDELSNALRGTATLTGFARDSYGVAEPVWKVRAGDRIRFDGGVERRIIETSYNHEERTILLTLDSTPNRVDALMAKMEVELVSLGSGS